MTAALRELRQFTSPIPCKLDGSPLPDTVLMNCGLEFHCKYIPTTKKEWLDDIDEDIRYGIRKDEEHKMKPLLPSDEIIEARLKELRDNFPELTGPFILSHTDLNFGNIMVHDGQIEAIIDWDGVGYYPWWVERWGSYMRGKNGDPIVPFWDRVWGHIFPDQSADQLEDYMNGFYDVKEMIRQPDHTEEYDLWLRPPWCECKPYGGTIMKKCVGPCEMKHSAGKKGGLTWERDLGEECVFFPMAKSPEPRQS